MDRRTFLRSALLASIIPQDARSWRAYDAEQSGSDEEICAAKFDLALATSLHEKPIAEVAVEVGRSFIGTRYLAQGLEAAGEERLVVNLRGLDCVTFCENVTALARCIKKQTMTFEKFKKELQDLRYRGGVIDGYPSRLHYFTDFIHENEQRGVLENVTAAKGGKLYSKRIHFMSSNSNLYRQLRENPAFVETMRRHEHAINDRTHHHIPKADVAKMESALESGDLIGITTTVEGLDVVHTGFVVRHRAHKKHAERIHLLHAPNAGSTVSITTQPLAEYLARHPRHSGIMVARLREP
jgi:hypothetical protein